MPGRLQGKVAMITGGNSGIGEATAHRFAQEGATVVLLARREPEGYAVQQAIRDTGGEAYFIPCDVSDRSAVEAAVHQYDGGIAFAVFQLARREYITGHQAVFG